MLVKNKSLNHPQFQMNDELPTIAIFLSALNEERIIEKKIRSIYQTSYPLNKIEVYVGSDLSTDQTNAILQKLSNEFSSLHAFYFNERRGKANVLNALKKELKSKTEIFIYTDANVLFTENTLFHLAKHFKEPSIGQVGANICNYFESNKPIAQQENFYIQRENKIKYDEGLLNGSMIGAFGACYAIRSELAIEYMTTFLMEDFFLSLSILQRKYKAILDLDAVCLEDLPGQIEEEYKRKKRISAGNYQNMMHYKSLLFPFSSIGFCYWSHKIFRWLTPFFLIIIALSIFCLYILNFIDLKYIIAGISLCAIFWIIDIILEKAQKQIVILRFARYFILMNLALLQGFLMYIKGINTNVWTPTQRKQ